MIGTDVDRPAMDASERLILACYGALGFTTLALQVAWTRQLIGMMGSAMGAVSIMLAVFMAGLASGSFIGGRLAQRSRDLPRLLSTMFVMAGVTTLLAAPLESVLSVRDVSSRFPELGITGVVIVVLTGIVPVMLLPSLFAGAAFPGVAQLASSRGNLTAGVGRALAAQTAGSVAGAFIAGFLLMPSLGVDGTFYVAAVVAVVAGLAVGYPRAWPEPAPVTAKHGSSGTVAISRAASIALVLSGMATLTYEVAWARELLLVFSSSVYATAIMLAAILLGLGIGQTIGARRAAGVPSGLVLLTRLLIGAAGMGAISVVLIRLVPVAHVYAFMLLPGNLFISAMVQLLLSTAVVLGPAILIGIASPLMIRYAVAATGERARTTGFAYAINTAGAVIGALVAGFVLLPAISAKGAILVAVALQVAAAAVILRVTRPHTSRPVVPVTGWSLLAFAVVALLGTDAASPLLNLTVMRPSMESAATYLDFSRQSELLYFEDAAEGRVAVYELPDGRRVLRGAGMVEGAQGRIDAQTTELLVRIPAQVAKHAQDYLVIGLGTGSTTYTALQVPGVRSVDTVELNPAVIPASRFFVDDLLDRDDRSSIHVSDARVFLAAGSKTYDAIVSEPSYPLSPYSAQLFTEEFFELQRSRLNDGGVAVQWLPVYLFDSTDIAMMTRTFTSVFPETHVWSTYSENRPVDVILVGVKGESDVDPAAVETAIRQSVGDVFDFAYELDPDGVQAILKDASIPMNTDDRPLLEYRTPLRQIDALWR